MGERRLAVQRLGVVRGATDVASGEEGLQGVALRRKHRELVPHGARMRALRQRRHARDPGQEVPVAPCDPGSAGVVFLQKGKAAVENRCLQGVEPAVGAHELVVIARRRPMIGQQPHPLGKRGIVGRDRPAVAEATQVLRGIEAPARQAAEAADRPALPARAVRLGGVLDQPQPAVLAQIERRVDIEWAAVEMHSDDPHGPPAEPFRDVFEIEVEAVRSNVGEDRRGAGQRHGFGGRGESESRHDDLVAGTDAVRPEGHLERIRAVGDADAVLDLEEVGEGALELLHLGAAYERRLVEEPPPAPQQFAVDAGGRAGEVEHRYRARLDGHGLSLWRVHGVE